MKKQQTKDFIRQFIISFLVLIILILIIAFILSQIGESYGKLPPANSTEEWKVLLNDSNPCKWYQFGCQKLSCVIDCNEINREAGDIICVC